MFSPFLSWNLHHPELKALLWKLNRSKLSFQITLGSWGFQRLGLCQTSTEPHWDFYCCCFHFDTCSPSISAVWRKSCNAISLWGPGRFALTLHPHGVEGGEWMMNDFFNFGWTYPLTSWPCANWEHWNHWNHCSNKHLNTHTLISIFKALPSLHTSVDTFRGSDVPTKYANVCLGTRSPTEETNAHRVKRRLHLSAV